ncbi:MAG: ATP cone domain-containing protein [Elusimicrobia bacterium]|nr:ATP cone domain-containing protein [Elusimicrobiota bacterium]
MVKETNMMFPEDEITSFKINRIIKRDGRIVAFDKDKIIDAIFRAAVEVGGGNRELADSLANKVVAMINRTYSQDAIPSVEEIQDLVEKALVENGHYTTAKAFILYRAEHKRLREGKQEKIIVQDNIPYKILWKFFTWNVDHNCDSAEKLNKQVKDGTIKKLISDAEKLYHSEIEKVAQRIVADKDKIRMVIVAGPSSSGKTTTTTKIGEVLKKENLDFILLNLDNYFKDIEEHPKDEYGDYDFEAPQALDLALINEHLSALIEGKTVKMPFYDFKTGKRFLNKTEFKLEPNQILLIDSLHGLYDELTKSIPHSMKFKFYIEAICQIRDKEGEFVRWSDLRMLRRMVRDSWHRSYDPVRTVGHWHYVRRSEMKYIVPFINKVDYVFNGALPFELPIHRKFMMNKFPEIIKAYESDPHKLDAYIRAKRVYKLLGEFEDLDESLVPKNSLLREFIGGSSYKY